MKIIGAQDWYRPDGRLVQRKLGKCDCGRTVLLSGFTNVCDCGADYNMSGDRLAPRSQWGEETGESIADILSADSFDWSD